jgi:hypothetical protein
MTPTEIFNAAARAVGAPTVQRPTAPAQWHTSATIQKFQNEEREAARHAAKAGDPAVRAGFTPNTPGVVVPPQGTPAERAADAARFTPKSTAPTGSIEVDPAAIEAVNARYRELAPGLNNEATQARFRALQFRDLESCMMGRRNGEAIDAFYARIGKPVPMIQGVQNLDSLMAPTKASKAAAKAAATAAAVSQYTPAQWEAGHASITDDQGYMPLDRVNVAGLSGYTLPKLIDGQTVHRSVFTQLADARAAGMTQEQVTAYLTAQMRRDGHIK